MTSTLFSAPAWFWTSLVCAAIATPILIHLINLFRYRKVKWAAMDFLLKSHRKKQKKILLTQVILIATRILLLVLAIFYFGQIGFGPNKDSQFPKETEHVVILDDSYSMQQLVVSGQTINGDENTRQTCYNNAQSVLSEMVRKLATQPDQRIRLVLTSDRFSEQTENVYDCDSTIQTKLDQFFADKPCSDSSESPLRWMDDNLAEISETSPVYVLTDYRSKDFDETDSTNILNTAIDRFPEFNIIICSDSATTSNNLSVRSLIPENGFIAASVPFFVSLQVENHSATVAKNTEVKIRLGSLGTNSGNNLFPRIEFNEEPTVLIPEIKGHSVAEVQIPLLVNQPGQFIIEADLPDDELNTDNLAHRKIEVRNANQALLIAETNSSSVRYLEWLLDPKSQGTQLVNSGFRTDVVQSTQFGFSDVNVDRYQVIFLLSDDLTNPRMIKKLEEFVSDGGLLFWVPGKFADIPSINRLLHKNGQGLLRFPLVSSVDLPERNPDVKNDIQFIDDAIGKYFEGESAKLIPLIHIYKKFILPRDWDPEANASTILATVRGRATTPLVIASKFDKGKVISFLTPFDEEWNNWARNPTFLVLVYQLVYQNLEFDTSSDKMVGDKVELEKSSSKNVYWMNRFGAEFSAVETSKIANQNTAVAARLTRQGIYSVSTDSPNFFAAKIDTADSDLQCMPTKTNGSSTLEKSLSDWTEFSFSGNKAKHSLLFLLLVVFLVLLIIEQWLGYKLGFHQGLQAGNMTSSSGGRNG